MSQTSVTGSSAYSNQPAPALHAAGIDSTSMEQIGEYIVRRMIGEGGMGHVYEAEERLSKRKVALKVLREELARSEHARGLFLNEMQILAHLEHPNIVRSLASIEADGKLVMVLELLDGITLRDVLASRGRLTWEQATHVIVSVARGLTAAHGQAPPVIHRDLKPENIMVLDDGTVKVMDFGIAKLVQQLNQTNTQSVGTLQYMSPEQIDAQTVDQRTDLYCLGLVFYELLAGEPPFQSASPRLLLNMQCTDEPPTLPDDVRVGLSKGIQSVLFELLKKAPADRPASAREVVERLELFLPDRSFDDITSPAAKPRAVAASAVASSRPGRADTPQVASSGDGDTLHSEDDARPGRARRATPVPAVRVEAEGNIVRGERKDTVALIDAASGERELSTGVSLLVILVLMLLAGAATYAWRMSQAPAEPAPQSLLSFVVR